MAESADQHLERRRIREGMTIGETLVEGTLGHRVVDLVYHGFRRSVEPYLVGIHEAGEAILLAYQIAGFSHSGDVPGWRTFILAEISEATLTDCGFSAPRRDFNRDDPRMNEIFARA